MSTIYKEHINKSIETSKKKELLRVCKGEPSISIYTIYSGYNYINNLRGIIAKARKSDFNKLIFGKKRKSKRIFPRIYTSSMIRFHNDEIIRENQKEDKALATAKLTSKYLDLLNLDIQKIKYKETNESYLIEFLYQKNYFLIEFFHDNDIVLLIRNNENNNRKAWDFTIDQIINLLQVIEKNIIIKNE